MSHDDWVDDADRLRAAIGRVVRAARVADTMPANQAATLGHLVRDGALSIAELARRERVKHQSMSRTVGLLEQAGLVTQAPDPANGRQAAVTATAAGRAELDRERHARAAAMADVLAQWTDSGPAELRRTTAFLERLADAFDSYQAD